MDEGVDEGAGTGGGGASRKPYGDRLCLNRVRTALIFHNGRKTRRTATNRVARVFREVALSRTDCGY